MGFPGGSGQFSSVTQSCTTLCDPMDFSKPGFSVHHQLPELAQTHVHQVDDAIQPSHPLSSPSPPAFNLCQYQSLFFKKKLIYFNWRLITLQCCGGFLPYFDMNQPQVYLCSPSLWVVPVHWLWVPCFMHQTWTGDLFHIWQYTCFSAILSNHPTLSFSHRVQKSVLYICISFAVLHIGSLIPSF